MNATGFFPILANTRFRVTRKWSCRSLLLVNLANKICCAMLNQNNSRLLTTQTPLKIPKRTMDSQISLENPLTDYKKLIENMLNDNLSDAEQNERYKSIAAQTRNIVWKLLFDDPQPPSDERMKKAGELLKEHKMDACFFVPWDYNDWVIGFRDELLKRQNLEFWRNVVVKEELGMCCARDSDYFDDMEDPEPVKFYEHAECKAPWLKEEHESKSKNENAAAITTSDIQSTSTPANSCVPPNDNYEIKLENPLEDYKNLIKVNLTQNTTSNDEQVEAIYKAIAESARKTVWSLLFDDPQPPPIERQTKAGDLLKEHKIDAGFYAPWVYNDWVVKLKDEVLKRELMDFWRNQMVKRELGVCWARDSDYFDEMEDPEPAKFYEHAGCVAAWLKETAQNRENERKSGDGK